MGITCAKGKRCSVACDGNGACTQTSLDATLASSLCIRCNHDNPGVGNEACGQLGCNKPAVCNSTGNEPAACGPMCNDALDCAF